MDWPTYKSIADHTEAMRIEFDPSVTSYQDILIDFFAQHSAFSRPYSRQYRSAIMVHNDQQRKIAQEAIKLMSKTQGGREVYTDLEDADAFYAAEEYHQKYVAKQQSSGW